MERYQRQTILKQFGSEGQDKLTAAQVLVVGAGGLGCPVLMYLAAAGVGHIGIVDQDVVSLSNLHRQIIYSTEDIGKSKVECAAFHLEKMNPDIKISQYQTFLAVENALEILKDYNVIVDATDNFPSRYLINDACVLLGKPLVYGAVSNFEGQVAVFNLSLENDTRAANYRDIFPIPPMENEIGNCAEIGVLGVLPGIIGCIQASEVIKLLTSIGKPLSNQLQTVNLLTNHWHTFSIHPSQDTFALIPTDFASFKEKDYNLACRPKLDIELEYSDFNQYFDKEDTIIIDVRETSEKPEIDTFLHLKYPLSIWDLKPQEFEQSTIIVFCQSGSRSLQAAQLLVEKYPHKKIFSLKNGILHWQNQYIINEYES